MRLILPLTTLMLLIIFTHNASAQVLLIQQNINGRFNCWWGSIEYYDAPSPVPPRYHGPSIYQNYGVSRLYGRLVAMPGGMAPPGPQAIDRFTIGRGGPTGQVSRPLSPPVRATRYAHPSYQNNRQSRYAHY
ncbi:hypothetical protein K2Y11_01760 [bacterium]|nr:hypothetical protein [bacterium]